MFLVELYYLSLQFVLLLIYNDQIVSHLLGRPTIYLFYSE